MLNKGTIIKDSYIIERLIGEGSMSYVYSVFDKVNNRRAALKILKNDLLTGYYEYYLMFKREQEIISSINHPSIVKVFDFGKYQNTPFIVMELLEGQSLEDMLHQYKSFTLSTCIDLIYQLSEAVNYIHQSGIIHCDIKPGNIYISSHQGELKLKLLDFGLSYLINKSYIKGAPTIAGSFGYMSPESTGILNRQIDERSDLYSIGAVFYHLVTGKRPFNITSLNEAIHQHIAFMPFPPSTLNLMIPEVIDKIILKLLHKDSEYRYQSVKGLLYDLSRIRNNNISFTPGEYDIVENIVYNPSLVGREKEKVILKKALDKALSCNGNAVFVKGEPGVGKTRLIQTLQMYTIEKGGLFLQSRSLIHENKVPFQLIKDLLDSFLFQLLKMSDSILEEYRDKTVRKFGNLLSLMNGFHPEISKNLHFEAKALPSLDADKDASRFLVFISDFILSLCSLSPIVIFLDDLQWTDSGSLDVLLELVRNMKNCQILLLGAYRTNETLTSKFESILEQVGNYGFFAGIHLHTLNKHDSIKLIDKIVPTVSSTVRNIYSLVFDKSCGNPLYIISIIRDMIESKALIKEGHSWTLNQNIKNQFQIPDNMVELRLDSTNHLHSMYIKVLCQASVLGMEFNPEYLYGMVSMDISQVVEILNLLVKMQLIHQTQQRNRMIFAHDRIRDAFYSKMTEDEKKNSHRMVAKRLEEEYLVDSEVIFDLVHHYTMASDIEKMKQYLLPAARKARNIYAHDEAVTYYNIYLNIMESEKLKAHSNYKEALFEMSESMVSMGKSIQVIDILKSNEEFFISINNRIRALSIISWAYFKISDFKNTQNSLKQCLDILNEPYPKNTASTGLMIAHSFLMGTFHGFLGNIFNKSLFKQKGIEIVKVYETWTWMNMMSDISMLAYIICRLRFIAVKHFYGTKHMGTAITAYASMFMTIPLFKLATCHFKQALLVHKKIGDELGTAYIHELVGFNYTWMGLYDKAIISFQASSEIFKRYGDMWQYGFAINGLGHVYRYIGDYKKALELQTEYHKLSIRLRDLSGISAASDSLAAVYMEMGEFKNSVSYADKSYHIAEEKKHDFFVCSALITKGIIAAEQNQYEDSFSYFKKAVYLDKSNYYLKDYTKMVYPLLADVKIQMLYTTFIDKSKPYPESLLKEIQKDVMAAFRETRHWKNHRMLTYRAAAQYYALKNDNLKAERYFKKSIHISKQINRKYEIGKSHYAFALFLNRKGRTEESKYHSFCAYDIFKDIGAQKYIKLLYPMLFPADFTKSIEDEKSVSKDLMLLERRLATVMETNRYTMSVLDVNELLKKIMDSTMVLLGAQRGVFYLYNNSGNIEKCMESSIDESEIKLSRGIIAKVIKHRKAVIFNDADTDQEFKINESILFRNIRSVLCAPILVRDEMIGLIYLDNSHISGLFNNEDLEILKLITSQAGASIEISRLYNKLKDYSQEIEEAKSQLEIWNKELEATIAERTCALEELNRELRDYAAKTEELSIMRERNRIAREVHDTLGHSLSLLINILQVTKMHLPGNVEMADRKLEDACTVAREGLNDVRRSIKGLVSQKLENTTLIFALEKLIEKYEKSGLSVYLSYDNNLPYLDSISSDTIFKITQEALTNAIRHGNATEAHIILKTTSKGINLFIYDNGKGIKNENFKEGYGIKGMRERVKTSGGIFHCGTTGKNGFHIRIEIPVNESVQHNQSQSSNYTESD